MKEIHSKLLRCPKCKSELEITNPVMSGQEVVSATLKCTGCLKEYKIMDCIPVFVEK